MITSKKIQGFYQHYNFPKKQSGVVLVAALFLMLVIALLLIYMMRTSTETYWSGVLRIQQARAYQAAQAGLEWGLFNVNPAVAGACPASPTTLTFAAADGDLAGFTVVVSCSLPAVPYMENGVVVPVFELDAVSTFGTYGTSADYVSQHLRISVEG